MVNGPGLYLDIGKKARGPSFSFFSSFFFFDLSYSLIFAFSRADLLYKDYQSDHKFTVTTYTSTGVVSFIFCWKFSFCLVADIVYNFSLI